jgi:hypothetical protein
MTHSVEVCLQEVHLLRILEQSRPVGLTELLLLQHKLDGARRVVGLGGGGVDVGVEFEGDGVIGLFGLGEAGEDELAGLDIELDLLGVDVRHGDGQEDVVLLGLAGGGALGPGDLRGDGLAVELLGVLGGC